MKKKPLSTKDYLFSGEFSRAIQHAKEKDDCWLIGALCFTGQLEQAESLFKKNEKKMRETEIFAARFFLAIGNLRSYNLRRARKLLQLNKKTSQLTTGQLFYRYQGLALLRYYKKQWKSAEALAMRSSQESSSVRFHFGWYLSLDLLGHIHVAMGNIPKGIEELSQAAKRAKQLNNKNYFEASDSSKRLYEVQFGFCKERPVLALQKQIKELSTEDNVSRINISLELCRQLTLSGDFANAEKSLQEVQYSLYSKSLPRQEVLFGLRSAELCFQKGEFHNALSHLANTRKTLDVNYDPNLLKALLGLELKVLNSLNFEKEQIERVKSEILLLSKESPNFVNQKIVQRQFLEKIVNERGVDRIGDLIDDIHFKRNSSFKEIQKIGYLSLFIQAFSIQRGRPTLVIGAFANQLLFYCKEGMFVKNLKNRGYVYEILLSLARSSKSKKQLVEEIWNYDYEAMRHDSLVYTQVTKLRKILGEFAQYLVFDEKKYYLDPRLKIHFHSIDEEKIEREPSTKEYEKRKYESLNYRQITLLREMGKKDFISTPEVADKFSVTDITANRDLRELVELGLLLRLGKARATRYIKS